MEMEWIRRELKMTKRGKQNPIRMYLEDLRMRKEEVEAEMETLKWILKG